MSERDGPADPGSRLEVECFRITGPPAGRYGDVLQFEGRVRTSAGIVSMELRFGGVRPFSFRIENVSEDKTPGGQSTPVHRFALLAKTPVEPIDLGAVRLAVHVEGGSSAEIALGPPAGHEAIEARRRDDSALVMSFESCGDNCEFGLLQRTLGNERIGLLRYAGVGRVGLLADAIERRFDALDDPAGLRADIGETGWMVSVPALEMSFHTGLRPDEIDERDVLAFVSTQLRFVADKFIEDLEEAGKIFVFRTPLKVSNDSDMIRLHDAMGRFGPVRLLWVTETDGVRAPGSIVAVRDGLYRGFLERLLVAGGDYYASTFGWLELARQARVTIGAG